MGRKKVKQEWERCLKNSIFFPFRLGIFLLLFPIFRIMKDDTKELSYALKGVSAP